MRKQIALFGLALLCVCGQVHALSRSTEIAAENLKKLPFTFTINVREQDDGDLEFTIRVDPKEEELSPFRDGKLTVKSDEAEIARCSLKDTDGAGASVYSFVIAKDYVKESHFGYFNWAHANGEPMPAFDAYWFKLSTFADRARKDKPAGAEQPPAGDRQPAEGDSQPPDGGKQPAEGEK